MSEADSARPTPLRGRNGLSEGSSWRPGRRRAASPSCIGIGEQRLVQSGCLEYLSLRRGRGREQARVHVRQRVLQALPRRALNQRRELQELEVADDAVGDVKVGIQTQLAETPADARDALEHFVAQLLKRRLAAGAISASGGPAGPSRPAAVVTRRGGAPPAGLASQRSPFRLRWRASSRAPALRLLAHEVDRQPVQACQALPLLGRILGSEQRPAARPEAPRSGVGRRRPEQASQCDRALR